MRSEHLSILEDRAAQKMALSWEFVVRDIVGEWKELDETRVIQAWSRRAGVAYAEASRYARNLWDFEICLEDGQIAEAARDYIRGMVVKNLTARTGR